MHVGSIGGERVGDVIGGRVAGSVISSLEVSIRGGGNGISLSTVSTA